MDNSKKCKIYNYIGYVVYCIAFGLIFSSLKVGSKETLLVGSLLLIADVIMLLARKMFFKTKER